MTNTTDKAMREALQSTLDYLTGSRTRNCETDKLEAEKLRAALASSNEQQTDDTFGPGQTPEDLAREHVAALASSAAAPGQAEVTRPYGACCIIGPAEDVSFVLRHLPDVDDEQPAPDAEAEPVAWFRYECSEPVFYRTKAWDDLIPLYTRPSAPLSEPTAEGVTDAWIDALVPVLPQGYQPSENSAMVFSVWQLLSHTRSAVRAALSSPASSAGMDAQRLESLRRSLAVIGVVGQIDGHEVVRRSSVLDIAAMAATPPTDALEGKS